MSSAPADLAPVEYDQWSEVSALGLVVKLDGQPYTAISATWTENSHGATDAMTVVVPLSSNPDFPVQLFRGDPQFLQQDIALGDLTSGSPASEEIVGQSSSIAAGADVGVEVWVGFPQSPTVAPTSITQLTCFFTGEVDSYTGDFAADTVTFKCRSLGAHLVDDTLTNVSTNQTIGQFLTDQAAFYSLPPPVVNIDGNTPATIQEVLAYDQVGGSNYQATLYGMHPMDLAIRGAQVDDTDVWVDSRTGTIHYESPDLIDRGTPIDLKWGRDWIGLSATHSPQFSDQVEVIAYTHQPRTRTTTSVHVRKDANGNVTTNVSSGVGTADSIMGTNQTISNRTSVNQKTGTSSSSSSISSSVGGNFKATATKAANQSSKQIDKVYVGNVSPERAASIAKARRRQISQHLYMIEGEVPITNRLLGQLSITSLLRIHGNPWSLTNSQYYPRSIEYTASVTEGFRAKIVALSLQLSSGGV